MFHIRLDGLAGHHIPLHAQDPGHFMDQRDPLGFSSHQIIRPFRNFFGQFLCRPAHKFHIPQDDEPGNGKRRGNRKNRQPARASGYFQFVKTVSHIFLPPPAKTLLSTGKSPLASAWKDLSTGSCPQGCGQAVDNSRFRLVLQARKRRKVKVENKSSPAKDPHKYWLFPSFIHYFPRRARTGRGSEKLSTGQCKPESGLGRNCPYLSTVTHNIHRGCG